MVDWGHEGARWFIIIVYCAVMIPVYFYIVQPVLVDFSPIFAYEGSVRPGPRNLGELMFFVFLIGTYLFYASVRMIYEFGAKQFFLGMLGILLGIFLIVLNIIIPEKYLPDRLHIFDD